MGKARCGHEASINDSNHCVNLLCGNHGAGARILFNSELRYSQIPQGWFLRAYATSVGMEVLLDDGKKHHVAFFNNEGYCRNATSHETRVEAVGAFQELIKQDLFETLDLPINKNLGRVDPWQLLKGARTVRLNPETFQPEWGAYDAASKTWIKNPCGEIPIKDTDFCELLGKTLQ